MERAKSRDVHYVLSVLLGLVVRNRMCSGFLGSMNWYTDYRVSMEYITALVTLCHTSSHTASATTAPILLVILLLTCNWKATPKNTVCSCKHWLHILCWVHTTWAYQTRLIYALPSERVDKFHTRKNMLQTSRLKRRGSQEMEGEIIVSESRNGMIILMQICV